MAVRARHEDDLGWDDLPGGLPFNDTEPLPPPPPPRSAPARVLRVLLVLVVLAGAGLVGARWAGEQDVRDVSASSAATYSRVLSAISAANDPPTLASAAALAPRSAQRLLSDLDRLRDRGGERRNALAALVERERDVLLALAPIERLADAPLSVWGSAHGPLTDAVVAELSARQALVALDGDAAEGLPDTSGVLRHVAATVSTALVQDVQRSAGEVLDGLAGAQKTADLRSEAERAAGQRAAVAAAEDGLGSGSDATVLTAFAAALEAVGELRRITPADTASWPGIRSRLSEQLRFVADSDDSLIAGSVRARLPLVLSAVDGVVARAADAHAAWQPEHDAAVAQQVSDAEAARRHGDVVREAAGSWDTVRADVAATAARGTVATGSVLADLDRHSAGADRLLATLRGSGPPAGTEEAFAVLVTSVEQLAAPLRAAFDEARLSECQECPASELSSWSALSRATAASASWSAALPAWEAALAEAQAAIASRELPPPPDA